MRLLPLMCCRFHVQQTEGLESSEAQNKGYVEYAIQPQYYMRFVMTAIMAGRF